MILLDLLLNTLICIAGFKEAWGYSMSSYEGMQSIFGKRLDHAPWNTERVVWVLIPFVAFRYIGDYYELLLVLICFALKFMFLHQLAYNSTMVLLKMQGYGYNINESRNTTTRLRSHKYIKISLFIAGVVILLFHELLLSKIIPIFHPIK